MAKTYRVFPAKSDPSFFALKVEDYSALGFLFHQAFTTSDGQWHVTQAEDKRFFKFSIAFYDYIKQLMSDAGFELEGPELQFHTCEGLFDISDQGDLRDDQYEVVKKIYQTNRGTINIGVSWGKSFTMVYLAQRYIGKGNLLISVNSDNVAKQLKLDCEEAGVDMSRIRIFNAIGFAQSAAINAPAHQKWLADVDSVLVDECDSLTDSLERVLTLCCNKKVAFGFSANIDRWKGTDLTSIDCIPNINSEVFKIIEHFGFSLHYEQTKKPVALYVIPTGMKKEIIPKWVDRLPRDRKFFMEKMFSTKTVFESDAFYKGLTDYVLPNVQSTLYIPIRYIKHGEQIFDWFRKNRTDLKVVLWDAKKGIRYTERPTKKYKLEELKQIVNVDKELDVLVASSVSYRGLNLVELSDIVCVIGSMFGSSIQQVGRVCRYETPAIWTFEPTNPSDVPIYNKDHNTRMHKWNIAFKIDRRPLPGCTASRIEEIW